MGGCFCKFVFRIFEICIKNKIQNAEIFIFIFALY